MTSSFIEDVAGLATLLDLAGSILDQEDGYWIKIEAWCVAPKADIPHGIRYALTLHAPDGVRLLGYDNAHAVKVPRKSKLIGRKLPYDHKHCTASDKGIPYIFKDAYQLLSDFFDDADRVLKEVK